MLNLSSIVFSGTFTRILLGLLLLALRLTATAQAPAWQSARAVATATAAAGNYLKVNATTVDATGNVYLAGEFRNTVVLGGTTLTSLGDNDIFLAKFNPVSNQFVWARRAGGTWNDEAYALSANGMTVYVAGKFTSTTADFGPITLTRAESDDVFVAKLTDAGSFVWAQRAGGIGSDVATALAVSGSSVYVAGSFEGSTAEFGPVTLANAGLPYSPDVFVAKLTDAGSTGTFVWAQRAGGTDGDQATALAVSSTSVYVTGQFASATAGFGTTTLTSAGFASPDVFVAKLTDAGSMGSFAWAQRAGGTGFDYARALAVSGTSVYVTGYFDRPNAHFGAVTLTSAGFSDVFVAKLTDAGSTGSFAWAQRAGGTGNEAATALTVGGTSVYVTGYFYSPMATFGATILTNAGFGFTDVFVAKLTDAGSTGSFAWAQRAGGADGTALALSGTSVYVAGSIGGPTANFGAIALTNPNPGSSLGFLASLTDPTLTSTAAGRALTPAQLFPNPARRTATLRLPAGTPSAPLILTDALGRAVRRYPAPTGPETALDLSGLPAGLYLLRGAGPAQRLAVE